jgi:hypothetical protein
MKLSILATACLTLYVATALASFRYPNGFTYAIIEVLCGLTLASVAVIAFDRWSTPLFGFLAFGLSATFANTTMRAAIIPVMKLFGTRTGANEYNYLLDLLQLQATILLGVIGYFFGVLVTKRRPPVRGNAVCKEIAG